MLFRELSTEPDADTLRQRDRNRIIANGIYTASWVAMVVAFLNRDLLASLLGDFLPLNLSFALMDNPSIVPIVVMLIGGAGSVYARQYQELADYADTEIRRQEAERARESLLRSERYEKPIFLFLRPFELEGQLELPNPHRRFTAPVFMSYFSQPEHVDFEVLIREALSPAGLMLGIGERIQVLQGSSKLDTAGRSWESDFSLMANAASGIICIPWDSPSSKWEVAELMRTGLIAKTVFLMPPQNTATQTVDAEAWERVRVQLLESGIPVPAYARKGVVWRLDPERRLQGVASLPGGTPVRGLRKSILRNLPNTV